MSECAGCGRRLARAASFCPSCGRSAGAAAPPTLEIETDDATRVGDGHEVVLAPARARRWTVGAAIAVVAAVVAASVASGGGDDRSTTPTTTTPSTTTPASTSTVTTAPTTTTVTAAPTTTVAPTTLVFSPAPLVGEPTGLAVLAATAEGVFRIDLDNATVVRTPLDPTADLRVTPAGLVWRDPSDGSVHLTDDAGERTELGETSYLGAGPPDRSWFSVYDGRRSTVTYLYADGPGPFTAVALPEGAGYALADGTSGLVINAAGGVYRWRPGDAAPARVAAGQMNAVGGGRILLAACDDAMACAAAVLDPATGARRVLPPVPGLTGPYAWSALSPDGRVVLGVRDPNSEQPVVVALTPDGGVVELGRVTTPCLSANCSGAPQWSPDGRWLVWSPDERSIRLWREGLPEPLTVDLPAALFPVGFASQPQSGLSVTIGPLERLRRFDGT